MRIAIPVGLLVAVGFGVVRVIVNNPDGPLKWLGGIILGVAVAPFAVALVATLVVDRSTLKGAVRNPGDSVESVWYDKSAAMACHVTLGACGVGAFVAMWLEQSVVSYTLIGVWGLTGISLAVAYLIQKGRA